MTQQDVEIVGWMYVALTRILDRDPILDGDRQHGLRHHVRDLRTQLRRMQRSPEIIPKVVAELDV